MPDNEEPSRNPDRTATRSSLSGHGSDLEAALDGRDDAVPLVLLARASSYGARRRADRPTIGDPGHGRVLPQHPSTA
jgi:hypothetical protein